MTDHIEHYEATYSVDDDKIRVYCGFVERPIFDQLREAGFQRAHAQGCFYGVWTPQREDLLHRLFGITEFADEDVSVLDRADRRAERYDEYAGNAAARAQAARDSEQEIARWIPMGQPILVGHHSEKRHRRDLDRIHRLADRQAEESRKADYWKDRAEASVRHAERRLKPDVIQRRIKKLEADLRAWERKRRDAEKDIREHVDFERSLASWGDEEFVEPDIAGLVARKQELCDRWIEHQEVRLAFERARYEASGGVVAEKEKPEVGGAILFIGTWYPVVRVNAKSVTIGEWFGKFTYRVEYDKVAGVMSKAKWDAFLAKARELDG